jgi:hypothetical protein
MAVKKTNAKAKAAPGAAGKGRPKGPAPAKPANAAKAPAPVRAASNSPLSSTSSSRMKRPLPAKSVEKAASAFSTFSLSRFAKGATPPNYLPHAQAKNPSAVSAVQRNSMATQTVALAANPPQTLGLTVALTPKSLAASLPSLDAKANTVDLAEVIDVLRQNLRGKEFYATSGNPTLNLIVNGSALLSQVQGYISAIKAGTVGTIADANAPGAAVKAAAALIGRRAPKVGVAVMAPAAGGQGVAAKARDGRRPAARIRKGGA